MNAPGVARGSRRAFLAPVWVFAAAALALCASVLAIGAWAATRPGTTIIVLRHAEKLADGSSDPGLSPTGHERATRLAAMLGDPVAACAPRAIYTSDARRTRETAEPLARRLGLVPATVARGDAALTIERALREHAGECIVVIGHSNTAPAIVAALSRGAVRPTIDEQDYSNLYVVSRPAFGRALVLSLHY